MKFGKVIDVENIDFTFPKDHPLNLDFLGRQSLPKKDWTIYFGCTGWAMKEWVGTYYPKRSKSADFAKHYGEQFSTIEFNTTHYRIPDESSVEKWKTIVPEDFKFSPKMLQRVSHSADLGKSSGLLKPFMESIGGLNEKLGTPFMQLPPFFGPTRYNLLVSFLNEYKDYNKPLAIELRHEDWFSSTKELERLGNLLKRFNTTFLITDVSGRRDVLHQLLTTKTAMVRFVGNSLHPSDFKRIDDWIGRLKTWFENGLEEVYFFIHQPDNILSPELTVYFVQQVNEVLGLNLRIPEKHKDLYQGSLF